MINEHIDVFISSNLHRSIQTCEIIAAPHHQAVEQVPLLSERDWGSFTGKYIPDLQDVKEWPDDIESLAHLKSRATNFLTYIKATYPDKTILAVGHGIINKAIQSVYYRKPMTDIKPMTNAEVRVLIL
jgi:probable phosphoglycerate mutase